MLHFIICVAIAIWTTSSIFMLSFWATSFIALFRQTGKFFIMPFGQFVYLHFCPIVHTVQCFKIMQRAAELYKEKRRV